MLSNNINKHSIATNVGKLFRGKICHRVTCRSTHSLIHKLDMFRRPKLFGKIDLSFLLKMRDCIQQKED